MWQQWVLCHLIIFNKQTHPRNSAPNDWNENRLFAINSCISLESFLIYWRSFVTLLNVDRRLVHFTEAFKHLQHSRHPLYSGHIWKAWPMNDLKSDHNGFWWVGFSVTLCKLVAQHRTEMHLWDAVELLHNNIHTWSHFDSKVDIK